MAAYAAVDDVLARAGRFAGVYSVAGRRPNVADLTAMIAQVSSEIDLEIRQHGYDPSILSADLIAALRDVTAWAVLVRTLPEAMPGDDAIEPTIERGRAVLAASGFQSLGAGVDVISAIGEIGALEAGVAGGGPGSSAGSFWDELPESETLAARLRRGDVVTATNGDFSSLTDEAAAAEPQFRRGMSL